MLLACSLPFHLFSQNRICGWETEKITSISVECTSPDNTTVIHAFDTVHDMDAILSFLKSVEFRELNSSNADSLEQDPSLEYILTFQGQRDQVYLYEHSASIGKTSFLTDPQVIKNFQRLIEALDEE